MKKLMQQEVAYDHKQNDDDDDELILKNNSQQFVRIMEVPELSLSQTQPDQLISEYSSSLCRKRKSQSDQTSVDLHLQDPLPLDWEQCLDLQSGRMYYLNRKSLKKSWERPKEQKLDLELNISSFSQQCNASEKLQGSKKLQSSRTSTSTSSSSSSSNMVALACLNCHLLVILSKLSPSCPNCKYVHSLPIQQPPPPSKVAATVVKSLDTLSLLN
ncbi:hypothetical protein CsSME_00020050 [Camellia sinensis var. sinensis]